MIKKRFVAGAMALCLVLGGTAYAYWTDALEINATASTADMSLKFIDLGLYAQYSNETVGGDGAVGWSIIDGVEREHNGATLKYVHDEFFTRGADYNSIAKAGSIEGYKQSAEGYNTVNFDAKLVNPEKLPVTIDTYQAGVVDCSDEINIDIKNMYPGYAQAFRTDIANVGSVAAKLSSIKFTAGDEENGNLKDMLGVALYVSREYTNNSDNEAVAKLAAAFKNKAGATFEIGGVTFVRLSALDDKTISEFTNKELLVIPSKNRMDVFMGIGVDPDYNGTYTTGHIDAEAGQAVSNKDDSLSMKKSASVKIKFLWDQFNTTENIEANPNILQQQNQ